jgi:hypothetical protein
MKTKIAFLLMAAGYMLISACQDSFLNTRPLDALSTSNFWTTENDAMMAVTHCYQYLGDFDNRIFLSCGTDDSYSWSNWPSDIQYAGNGSATANTGVFDHFWSSFYSAIAATNNVLDNIDKVPSAELSDSLRDRLKAEVRFIRAYAYQQLTAMYGDVPLITHIQPTDSFNVKRTPEETVANFIVSELTAAAKVLPVSYGSSDQGRVTRGAALALLAREQLYRGNWAAAATAAQAVMDLGVYAVDNSSTDAYNSLFDGTNKNSPEIILAAKYIKNTYACGIATWVGGPSVGGWSQVVPLQSLVDAYECTDGEPITSSNQYDPAHPFEHRDPRLKATIIVPGSTVNGKTIDVTNPNSIDGLGKNNASFSGYYYKKYVPADIEGEYYNNSYNDEVLIRYPEVLLIYAEASIEANNIDNSVYEAIDQVRERKGIDMPALPPGETQAELRTAVRYERRVEFPLEGLRLFDIRRWKIGATVMAGNAYGILNNYDPQRADYGSHVLVEHRSFDSIDALWPVPENEMQLNPNLVQNPGW